MLILENWAIRPRKHDNDPTMMESFATVMPNKRFITRILLASSEIQG